jgi:dTDP-4-amino-4,6-dideoxygalactose transaminase
MDWRVQLVEVEVTDADVEAVLDCLRSGWLTMGPRTQRLEAALAERIGVKHAIAVSSGTAALHLACRAIGLGPGDEAIVPDLTFVATAHAVRYLGADVALCDSGAVGEPAIDVDAVERLIGPRTKAVIAVHMWGYPAAVEALRELCDSRGLALIEDCAEAIDARTESGAAVGSIGDLGCFSFFSKKQLAVGEGGLVTTDDDDLAASVRSLRTHAMSSVTWERHRGHGLGYDVTDVGYNYRIDEPRAALAMSRLERLGADVESRRAAAVAYRSRLAGVPGIELPYGDEDVARSSHFVFPVMLADRAARDSMRIGLREAGIQTTVYPALHELSEYAALGSDESLPVAAATAARQLILPMNAALDEAMVELVTDQVAALAGAPAA